MPSQPWLALAAFLTAAPPSPPALDARGPDEPEGLVGSELAAGSDDSLWARAGLALRYTGQSAIPSTDVLFDAGTSLFAHDSYLAPGPSTGWASGLAFVTAGWQATPWLGFRLDLDSGLVRATRFPTAATVCASRETSSGLQVAAGAQCIGTARFDLATTAQDPARITSNGQPIGDEAAQTLFIRQLYADVQAGPGGLVRVRVGRERLRIADGLVYDDWGLGLDVDVDVGAVGPPVAIGLSLFYPTRGWPSGADWKNPVVAGTVEWIPSLGEWVGLWGAYSSDPGGDAYAVLQHGFVESEVARLAVSQPGTAEYVRASRSLAVLLSARPQGSSRMGWAGVSGRLEVGRRNEARFTAGVAVGTMGAQVNLAGTPYALEVPILGWMASLRWTSQPGAGLTVSPFLLWMTGESTASAEALVTGAAGTWSGFLAISPFITATNLFFQGGISEFYVDRRATASGVNARGVVAPGVELGWMPVGGVDLALKAAWLWADRVGPAGGASYGPEVDLNVSWAALPWLMVLGEADVLALGNFFPGPALARRFILGVNVVTP